MDEREKRLAYLQISTLQVYILIEQCRPEVVIVRRDVDDEILRGPDAIIRILPLELEIPLAELYERVTPSHGDSLRRLAQTLFDGKAPEGWGQNRGKAVKANMSDQRIALSLCDHLSAGESPSRAIRWT